jgi:hypothetical protein
MGARVLRSNPTETDPFCHRTSTVVLVFKTVKILLLPAMAVTFYHFNTVLWIFEKNAPITELPICIMEAGKQFKAVRIL